MSISQRGIRICRKLRMSERLRLRVEFPPELNELNIYSETRLKLPKPQYFVFYNGTKAEPDRQILKLSDSFPDDGIQSHLEVMVVALNINYGHKPHTYVRNIPEESYL